jgi:aspartyl-tRNA(Asn)/glutamyl-tRNA(Gln) amidotransferase subunit A
MSSELHFLSIAESSRFIAARDLSPVELTRACLARIEALNPVLNAFITITAEQAMDRAREAEAEIMRSGPRGPLHGVPYALKDIYDTRGIRTTAHSALHANRVPEADSACAERLAAAGGVLLGKLATHEFATGGPAYDLPWPPARNPWLLDRFPGGSSSGAGAAVAAGLAPGALGSDTGGSIRLPAAFCGLAGIKPTYGRVSKRGVLPLSWTLDNCGPLTWTVEDAAILLQCIAGFDPQDPSTVNLPVPDLRADLDKGIAGLRIGVVRDFHGPGSGVSEVMQGAMDASLDVLRGLGAQVVDVVLPSIDDYQACYRAIVMSEAFSIHGEDLRKHPEKFSAVTRFRILPGVLLSAEDHIAGLRFQHALVARTLEAMHGLDGLVTASIYGPAPVQAEMAPEGSFLNPPLSNPFNIAQLPAMNVCNGFCEDGLPLGMQVVGRPYQEPMVLRIAHAYEAATSWRKQRPGLRESKAEEVPRGAPFALSAMDDAAIACCRDAATRAGLVLDDDQLAGLCHALPHVERIRERLPRSRDYTDAPATVFRHAHPLMD